MALSLTPNKSKSCWRYLCTLEHVGDIMM